MTDASIPAGGDGAGPEDADLAERRREAARRRRRIDEVFGEVLPKTTSDEREPGHRRGFPLEHYRQSRPPHWGDKQ